MAIRTPGLGRGSLLKVVLGDPRMFWILEAEGKEVQGSETHWKVGRWDR